MWHKVIRWIPKNPGYFALACVACYGIYCITIFSVATISNLVACRSIVSAATAKFPDLHWSGGHGLEHISIHVEGNLDAQKRHEIESWLQEFKESQHLSTKVLITYDVARTSSQ
jgi:hypothetical protein